MNCFSCNQCVMMDRPEKFLDHMNRRAKHPSGRDDSDGGGAALRSNERQSAASRRCIVPEWDDLLLPAAGTQAGDGGGTGGTSGTDAGGTGGTGAKAGRQQEGEVQPTSYAFSDSFRCHMHLSLTLARSLLVTSISGTGLADGSENPMDTPSAMPSSNALPVAVSRHIDVLVCQAVCLFIHLYAYLQYLS